MPLLQQIPADLIKVNQTNNNNSKGGSGHVAEPKFLQLYNLNKMFISLTRPSMFVIFQRFRPVINTTLMSEGMLELASFSYEMKITGVIERFF